MKYTYAIEQAICAASVLHKDQVHAGRFPYPYITHLFATAMIVADYTDGEEAVVTALLHETLNKTGYTQEELKGDFGEEVQKFVVSISQSEIGEDENLSTKDTQKHFIKKLKEAEQTALTVFAAGKLHDMRSVVESYIDEPNKFTEDFDDAEDTSLFFYQETSNVLNRKLNNPILAEFNSVFTEYKNFVHETTKDQKTRKR